MTRGNEDEQRQAAQETVVRPVLSAASNGKRTSAQRRRLKPETDQLQRGAAGQLETEAEILHAIRLALGRQPDLVIWRLSQGRAEYTTAAGARRSAQHGLVNGAADLIGILTHRLPRDCYQADFGRFFALEVKSARGAVSEAQRMFGNLVRARGGFYAVVRSVDDALAAMNRARKGESQ